MLHPGPHRRLPGVGPCRAHRHRPAPGILLVDARDPALGGESTLVGL
jgi:hypothetical protein